MVFSPFAHDFLFSMLTKRVHVCVLHVNRLWTGYSGNLGESVAQLLMFWLITIVPQTMICFYMMLFQKVCACPFLAARNPYATFCSGPPALKLPWMHDLEGL